jgi:hypothetical protein
MADEMQSWTAETKDKPNLTEGGAD